MSPVEIEAASIFDLQQRLTELGWTRDELRAERDAVLAEISATHGGPGRVNLTRKAERVPLYDRLDACNAKLFPITEEISAIRREIASRPEEERSAA